MSIFKPSACVLLLGVSFVLTASCAGDDDDTTSAAGKGGSAGKAGAAGKAGRGGTSSGAGEAGATAQAGGGGRGGSAQGGSSGEAATAGAAGSDVTSKGGTGAISGTGGTAGSPEGGVPSSGGAGNGGVGGEPDTSHKACSSTCDTSDDCTSPAYCETEAHRCVECTTHTDCIPLKSGWVTTCTMDSECIVALGEVCVDLNGRGFCAPGYDSGVGCLFPGEVQTSLPKFGSSDMVDVCAVDSGRCDDNRCFTGCSSDPDFCTIGLTSGYGNSCDAASGHCTCEADGECTHGPGHCDQTTNRCVECSQASHCPGAGEGKDTCSEGRCGCSSATVCTVTALGDTPVCE